MIKVSIVLIATGKYVYFLPNLFESLRLFLPQTNKNIYIWTDREKEIPESDFPVIITKIYRKGFPGDTLYRFRYFNMRKNELLNSDFCFYMDVDLEIIKQIDNNFLPTEKKMIVIKHPGSSRVVKEQTKNDCSLEKNRFSNAFVENQVHPYVCGGFFGGCSDEFIKMSIELDRRIKEDDRKEILAIYHDESHLNWYINNFPDLFEIRDCRYAYPEVCNFCSEVSTVCNLCSCIEVSKEKACIKVLNKNYSDVRGEKKIATAELTGSLGNILFQTFNLFSFAEENNFEAYLPIQRTQYYDEFKGKRGGTYRSGIFFNFPRCETNGKFFSCIKEKSYLFSPLVSEKKKEEPIEERLKKVPFGIVYDDANFSTDEIIKGSKTPQIRKHLINGQHHYACSDENSDVMEKYLKNIPYSIVYEDTNPPVDEIKWGKKKASLNLNGRFYFEEWVFGGHRWEDKGEYIECNLCKQIVIKDRTIKDSRNYFEEWVFGEHKWIEKEESYICRLCKQEVSKEAENVCLRGYFQSYKYFEKHKQVLLNRLYNDYEKEIEDFYISLNNNMKIVSVHVRRNDYLKFTDVYHILGKEYYFNAMKMFPRDYTFLIFSDDIEWCKQNLHGENIVFSEGNSDEKDLFMMARCDHHIMANSTFSWWASYIDKKDCKIIAPYNWFIKGSIDHDFFDLFPYYWDIRVVKDEIVPIDFFIFKPTEEVLISIPVDGCIVNNSFLYKSGKYYFLSSKEVQIYKEYLIKSNKQIQLCISEREFNYDIFPHFHFTILILSYNCEKWAVKNLYWNDQQKYDNFEIIFIDAGSTDKTYEIVENYPSNKIRLIKVGERRYQTENFYLGTKCSKKGSIIVSVDGDDWLTSKNVLMYLAFKYFLEEIDMTYGLCEEYPYRDLKFAWSQIDNQIIKDNSYRSSNKRISHLRTWKRELFLSIYKPDLLFEKNFPRMAGDMSVVYPMLEMGRSSFLNIPVYAYNLTNNLSDFRVDSELQEKTSSYFLSLSPYQKIRPSRLHLGHLKVCTTFSVDELKAEIILENLPREDQFMYHQNHLTKNTIESVIKKYPKIPTIDIFKQFVFCNIIDYSTLNFDFSKSCNFRTDINVIIPVKGRKENLEFLINNLQQSISKSSLKIQITVVEYDYEKHHNVYCATKNVNYIFLNSSDLYQTFGKSICHNLASLICERSEYFLFHDVDCAVKSDFFLTLEKYIERGIISLQTYCKRRVIHVNEEFSNRIRNDQINVDNLFSFSEGVFLPNPGSTGGSILIKREKFFEIGGYDPELFWNYSPEDLFFFKKLGNIEYADDPEIEIFHLHHEPIREKILDNNKEYNTMVILTNLYDELSVEEKKEFFEIKKKLLPEKNCLSPGLSLVIRAKNEEENVEFCLISLLPLLKNPHIEIIFVDNNSTDSTLAIAKKYEKYGIHIYSYSKKVARAGTEHQNAVKEKQSNKSDRLSTIGEYWDFCLSKVTKFNFMKWDCDWVAHTDQLLNMINEMNLTDRKDKFVLWFSGETIYVKDNNFYKNAHSYELYNEPRCFSLINGFRYIDSNDGLWETAWSDYIITLPQSCHHHYGRGTFYFLEVTLGSNNKESIRYRKIFDKIITGKNFHYDKTGIAPVFYEIKRTSKDEFGSFRSELIDERDKNDYRIYESLKEGKITFGLEKIIFEPPTLIDNNFFIIVPGYNCEMWMEKCFESINSQSYKNYKVVVIDDASENPDHFRKIQQYCMNKNWLFIRNKYNHGALNNILLATSLLNLDDNDIIVTVDMDDWLNDENVLSRINLHYQDNTDICYGRFKYYCPSESSGIKHNSIGYSENVKDEIFKNKSFRKEGWVYSHLRTFKYKLWRKIRREDLLDPNNKELLRYTWDLAFMYPMLEMSSKISWCNNVNYVYNIEHPNNDFKKNLSYQTELEKYIRSLPCY